MLPLIILTTPHASACVRGCDAEVNRLEQSVLLLEDRLMDHAAHLQGDDEDRLMDHAELLQGGDQEGGDVRAHFESQLKVSLL